MSRSARLAVDMASPIQPIKNEDPSPPSSHASSLQTDGEYDDDDDGQPPMHNVVQGVKLYQMIELQTGLYSPNELRERASFRMLHNHPNPEFSRSLLAPVDPRVGTPSHDQPCYTCGASFMNDPGHGAVEELSNFAICLPHDVPLIKNVCNSVCVNCSMNLLDVGCWTSKPDRDLGLYPFVPLPPLLANNASTTLDRVFRRRRTHRDYVDDDPPALSSSVQDKDISDAIAVYGTVSMSEPFLTVEQMLLEEKHAPIAYMRFFRQRVSLSVIRLHLQARRTHIKATFARANVGETKKLQRHTGLAAYDVYLTNELASTARQMTQIERVAASCLPNIIRYGNAIEADMWSLRQRLHRNSCEPAPTMDSKHCVHKADIDLSRLIQTDSATIQSELASCEAEFGQWQYLLSCARDYVDHCVRDKRRPESPPIPPDDSSRHCHNNVAIMTDAQTQAKTNIDLGLGGVDESAFCLRNRYREDIKSTDKSKFMGLLKKMTTKIIPAALNVSHSDDDPHESWSLDTQSTMCRRHVSEIPNRPLKKQRGVCLIRNGGCGFPIHQITNQHPMSCAFFSETDVEVDLSWSVMADGFYHRDADADIIRIQQDMGWMTRKRGVSMAIVNFGCFEDPEAASTQLIESKADADIESSGLPEDNEAGDDNSIEPVDDEEIIVDSDGESNGVIVRDRGRKRAFPLQTEDEPDSNTGGNRKKKKPKNSKYQTKKTVGTHKPKRRTIVYDANSGRRVFRIDMIDLAGVMRRMKDETVREFGMDPVLDHPSYAIRICILAIPPNVFPSSRVLSTNGAIERVAQDTIMEQVTTCSILNGQQLQYMIDFEKEHSRLSKHGEFTRDIPWDDEGQLFIQRAYEIQNRIACCNVSCPPVVDPITNRATIKLVSSMERTKSIKNRTDTKQGVFREDAQGKIVDHIARSLVGEDPDISVTDVMLLRYICRTQTVRVLVSRHNQVTIGRYADDVQTRWKVLDEKKGLIDKWFVERDLEQSPIFSQMSEDIAFDDVFPTIRTWIRRDGFHCMDLKSVALQGPERLSSHIQIGDSLEISLGVELVDCDPPARPWRLSRAWAPEPYRSEVLDRPYSISQQRKQHDRALQMLHSMLRARKGMDRNRSDESVRNTVVVNRPPSLDKKSIQATRVCVGQRGATTRMNPSSMVAYNADCDGDLIAKFILQVLATCIEATCVMGPDRVILSNQAHNNEVSCIQDTVSAWFLMTTFNYVFSTVEMIDLCKRTHRFQSVAGSQTEIEARLRRWRARHPRASAIDDPDHWDARMILCMILPRGTMYTRFNRKSRRIHVGLNRKNDIGCHDPHCHIHIVDGWLEHGAITGRDLGKGMDTLIRHVAMIHTHDRVVQLLDDLLRVSVGFMSVVQALTLNLSDLVLPRSVYIEFETVMNQSRRTEAGERRVLICKHRMERERFDVLCGSPQAWVTHNDHPGRWEIGKVTSNNVGYLSSGSLALQRRRILEGAQRDEFSQLMLRQGARRSNRVTKMLAEWIDRACGDWFANGRWPDVDGIGVPTADRKRTIRMSGLGLFLQVLGDVKGKIKDVADQSLSIGQQLVGSDLIRTSSESGRMFPYFSSSVLPEERGYELDSLLGGLCASSFMTYQMTGRLKTTESSTSVSKPGEVHQALMAGVGNVKCGYDGIVRDVGDIIVAYSTGGTGSNGKYDRPCSASSPLMQCIAAVAPMLDNMIVQAPCEGPNSDRCTDSDREIWRKIIEIKDKVAGPKMAPVADLFSACNDGCACGMEEQFRLHDDLVRAMALFAKNKDNPTLVQFPVPFDIDKEVAMIHAHVGGRPDVDTPESELTTHSIVNAVNRLCARMNDEQQCGIAPGLRNVNMNDSPYQVLFWYIRSTLSSWRCRSYYRLNVNSLRLLLQSLWTQFLRSRTQPSECIGVPSGSQSTEPQVQKALDLKHLIGELIRTTEGIPRFKNLVSLTTSANDLIFTDRIRTGASLGLSTDRIKNGTGYELLSAADLAPVCDSVKSAGQYRFQRVKPEELFTTCHIETSYEAVLEAMERDCEHADDRWRWYEIDSITDSESASCSESCIVGVIDGLACKRRKLRIHTVLRYIRGKLPSYVVLTCAIRTVACVISLFVRLRNVRKAEEGVSTTDTIDAGAEMEEDGDVGGRSDDDGHDDDEDGVVYRTSAERAGRYINSERTDPVETIDDAKTGTSHRSQRQSDGINLAPTMTAGMSKQDSTSLERRVRTRNRVRIRSHYIYRSTEYLLQSIMTYMVRTVLPITGFSNVNFNSTGVNNGSRQMRAQVNPIANNVHFIHKMMCRPDLAGETYYSDIRTTAEIFDIDVACKVAVREMQHSLYDCIQYIDPSNFDILCGWMTCKGYLRPFSATGISKSGEDFLAKSCYQRNTENLAKGTFGSQKCAFKSSSTCLMAAVEPPLGTGMIQLHIPMKQELKSMLEMQDSIKEERDDAGRDDVQLLDSLPSFEYDTTSTCALFDAKE